MGGRPAERPTFYEDVLSVIVENCSSCHGSDGIGPYDLEDYETARSLAEVIAISTAERSMPPFNASNTGACGSFADARWLDEEEIELFAAWADAGAPEGDPDAPFPERPVPPELVGGNVVDVETPASYVPVEDGSGELDDYQCFLGDLDLGGQPRYIVGYEVVPENPAVTHHLVGYLVDLEGSSEFGGTNAELIQTLDDATPDQPGWNCFGGAGQGVVTQGTPIVWTPGRGAFNFPDGTGIRVAPGQALVMQTHFNLVNGGGAAPTVLRVAVRDSVEREAVSVLGDRFLATLFSEEPAQIPPGRNDFTFSWTRELALFDERIASWDRIEIFGVYPHMHEIGRRMWVTFLDGPQRAPRETCGLYVDRWDFQWQDVFLYEEPITLGRNGHVRVVCEWDSSGRTEPTGPGLGTTDEMCLLGVYAAEGR